MIKTIELNYPTFGKDGLKLKKEFNNWINILEENNGWGKSTILNTIISSYTLKFPWLRTLPEW
jgi:predicted ATPase